MGKINQYTEGTVAAGVKVLGSDESASQETKQYDIDDVDTYLLGKRTTAPASAIATGTAGDYAVESGFAYFCVATDTWERVAIATW